MATMLHAREIASRADLEVVHHRRAERLTETHAQVAMRRVLQVRLQPAQICEVDRRKIVGRVGCHGFVRRSVLHAAAYAHRDDRGNFARRALERGYEGAPLVSREIGSWFHQHDVRHHSQNLTQPRAAYSISPAYS